MDTINNQGEGFGKKQNDFSRMIKIGTCSIATVAFFLSVFLVAQTFKVFDTKNDPAVNRITVIGEGEIVAIPDTAEFSYTVRELADDVTTAQDLAATKNNEILALLKEEGIPESDIKTKSYNIQPKYEWQAEICLPGQYCRGGKNVIVGHEVSQTIKVVVKDMDKAGEILSIVGQKEISNITGLNFMIDDEEGINNEVRSLAISNAKEKAKSLEKDLGVRIKKIVSFNEESNRNYPFGLGGYEMSKEMMSLERIATPELPAGENVVRTVVYITFEIEN